MNCLTFENNSYLMKKEYIDTFLLIWLKTGIFATFVFWSFQLQLQYFKCSESVVSENKHALPENIVLVYSKVFLIEKSSFQWCRNKSLCVRRCILVPMVHMVWKRSLKFVASESCSKCILCCFNLYTEIFARDLFSRNFAYAKFRENQTLANWRYHSVNYWYW